MKRISLTLVALAILVPCPAQHRAIYGELLGKSPLFSLNYDQRFRKQSNYGAGFSVGAGIYYGYPNRQSDRVLFSPLSVPVSWNTLLGRKASHLELGVGITPIFPLTNLNEPDFGLGRNQGSGKVFGFGTIGYRLHFKEAKSPLLRVSFNPIFAQSEAYDKGFKFSVGLSGGFTF